MTGRFLFSILFLFIITCCSCEGYRSARGVIKDKTSFRPLDSVVIYNTTNDVWYVTDTSGRFEVHNGMGGCVPHCKDIIVRFVKTGYKTQELTNPQDTIFYLERQ